MKRIVINRQARLKDDPNTGHNRWHPDIDAIIEVAPGELVQLETRDAADGQVKPHMTVADLDRLDAKAGHPLTGPIWVAGAEPGDLLEVEFVDIVAQDYGWTRIRPGAGFLRDYFDQPFLAHWHVTEGFARSEQIPGVRIPDSVFMGTSGVAPSHQQMHQWAAREADLVNRGGLALLPDAQDAVPSTEPIASAGLRTMPPRENGGNADIKQLTRGSRLQLPVNVPGALFSTGDAHYAQGDSECCITAIEMGATVTVRFQLHKQLAAKNEIRNPRFFHSGFFLKPEWAAPYNLIGTVGYPIRDDGR
ncbi:MAG: acetamidase/formamidase family protein, partial [Burkholderiaceae bacterium]